jgi:hypothetical protein
MASTHEERAEAFLRRLYALPSEAVCKPCENDVLKLAELLATTERETIAAVVRMMREDAERMRRCGAVTPHLADIMARAATDADHAADRLEAHEWRPYLDPAYKPKPGAGT